MIYSVSTNSRTAHYRQQVLHSPPLIHISTHFSGLLLSLRVVTQLPTSLLAKLSLKHPRYWPLWLEPDTTIICTTLYRINCYIIFNNKRVGEYRTYSFNCPLRLFEECFSVWKRRDIIIFAVFYGLHDCLRTHLLNAFI